MFSARDLKDLMESKPFKPFKIHLSDGSSYEVINHDMAMISRNSIDIGLHPDPEGIAERIVRCAILHISKIEELQAA
jgi:hypothetical protein